MRLVYLTLPVCILMASSPAASQLQYSVEGAVSPRVASDPMPPKIAFSLYKQRMIALRSEAQELVRQDGGTLSDENRELIQRRIDLVERVYQRRLRDYNPSAYMRAASARP